MHQADAYENAFINHKNRGVCPAGREQCYLGFDDIQCKLQVYACSFSPVMEHQIDKRIREPFMSGEFNYDGVEKLLSISQDDSRWEICRDLSLKSKVCGSCSSFGKSCGGAGYCHIQNHKYLHLNKTQDIKQQLRNQMQIMPIWCEKKRTTYI